MKVITFVNQKGGVGKTTTATAIAYILNTLGRKTLLIDADEQCNSTDLYRADIDGVATLYDLILDDDPCTVDEAIQHTEFGDIIAGDPGLNTEDRKLSENRDYLRLKEKLGSLKGYQYVIIDTHPSANPILYNVLAASDEAYLVINADRFSVSSASMITDTVIEVKRTINERLSIAGMILCMFDERLKVSKDFLTEFPSIAEAIGTKAMNTRIRYTVKCREAQDMRMPIGAYSPNSGVEKDYEDLVYEMFGIRSKDNGKK